MSISKPDKLMIKADKIINVFQGSDQNRCAVKLLTAYSEGAVEEIERVAQSSTIMHLDHAIIKLATGDVTVRNESSKEQEESLDENDRTQVLPVWL